MNIAAWIRHASNRGPVITRDGQQGWLRYVRIHRRGDTLVGQARVTFADGRAKTYKISEIRVP